MTIHTKVQRNDIFLCRKGKLSSPRINHKKAFHIGQASIKIWVENSVSAIQHIGKLIMFFFRCTPLTKIILLRTSVVFPYIHKIKMACLVKVGEGCQKQNIKKAC